MFEHSKEKQFVCGVKRYHLCMSINIITPKKFKESKIKKQLQKKKNISGDKDLNVFVCLFVKE